MFNVFYCLCCEMECIYDIFILCGAPLKMAFLNTGTAGPMKVCLTLSSHKPGTKWLVFSLSSRAAHLCCLMWLPYVIISTFGYAFLQALVIQSHNEYGRLGLDIGQLAQQL